MNGYRIVASAALAPFVSVEIRNTLRKAKDGSGDYIISEKVMYECVLKSLFPANGCGVPKTKGEIEIEIATNTAKWE